MRIFVVCLLLMISSLSVAQTGFQEGKHYEVVAKDRSSRIEVTEFFSLFCGHCFQFEALIDTLKASLKPEATFQKSHVSYLPRDNEQAQKAIVKAFLTMRELEKEEELTKQFFAAIHVKGLKMDTIEEIKKIFLANDVNETAFDMIFNSEEIAYRADEMSKLWLEKKVSSVPTFLVNGKYLINMQSLSNIGELIALTNYLLEKE